MDTVYLLVMKNRPVLQWILLNLVGF